MKLAYLVLSIGIGLPLLSGCATTLKVTYDSDPQGAVLYQGQQKFGYTPYTLQYQVSDEDKKRGHKIIEGTTVRWASGATAKVNSLRVDLNHTDGWHGLSRGFTFQRPEGVPGSDVDARFALELERTRAIRRQAAAQERQAAAQEERARAGSGMTTSPTNCTSTVIGNTVNTSCY